MIGDDTANGTKPREIAGLPRTLEQTRALVDVGWELVERSQRFLQESRKALNRELGISNRLIRNACTALGIFG